MIGHAITAIRKQIMDILLISIPGNLQGNLYKSLNSIIFYFSV